MSLESLDLREVESAIEGILFASGEPLPVDRICLALDLDRPTAEQVLQKLGDYYAFERRGIRLVRMEDSYQLCSSPDYADVIRKAFEIAQSGRPGPVLIDIPKDVTGNKAEYEPVKIQPIVKYKKEICMEDIDKAVEMIEEAKRPFVFVGGGAILSDASEELRAFVDKVQCPVCDSLMGKGAFPGTDELYTGMLGMHGTKTSNLGVSECDLLIAIGTRFSDRVLGNPKKFADQAKILQFDVEAAEINKNIRVTSSVIGDVKEILTRINKKLTQLDHNSWVEHVLAYAKTFPLTYHKEGLSGPFVIEKIYEMTKGNAIMVTEVGQHQMWAAQYYIYSKPRTLLTSGGLGTMGYGLGAAIGAQTANPDRTVVNIAGDGCFRMNMNELATASREKLPLIEVIINNHVLGMVRQWQTLFYEKHYSATVLDDGVDYVKLSEAMGATARRVKTQEEFEKAFADALKSKTPFVIDCIIDSDDKVWPMVAPGKPINESFDEEDYNATQGGN